MLDTANVDKPIGSWTLDWTGLHGALVLALSLRVLWALLVPVTLSSDSVLYHEFARSLANGDGYAYPDGSLTAYWPVGTSFVYATLYILFGERFAPIVALNIGLGLGIVWLTHTLARRHLSERVARLGAWFVAAWPLLIQFTTILASELLFIFLLLAALSSWSVKSLRPVSRGFVFGSLLCAAVYVRPTASPLFVLIPAIQWWLDRKWRDAVIACTIALLTATILASPWAIRNHQLFGKATLSNNVGANLWMGNNPESNGGYMPLPRKAMGNEAQRDAYLKSLALEFIRENPIAYLRLSLKRLVSTYSRESIGIVWNQKGLVEIGAKSLMNPLKMLSTLYWVTMLIAGAAGLVVALRRGRLPPVHMLTITPLFFFAVPVLTVSQDRYHMPLIPFVAIFAALAVSIAWTNKNVNQ